MLDLNDTGNGLISGTAYTFVVQVQDVGGNETVRKTFTFTR